MSVVPESGDPLLRDFLYVDLGRVRSLLAQLEQGVPEKVDAVREQLSRWNLSVKAIGGGETGKQTTEREQETRTLGDLHFTLFEEAAEIANFLIDLSDEAASPVNWTSGAVGHVVESHKIIRVTAPTRILDAHHFAGIIDQVIRSGFIKGKDKTGFEQVKKSIQLMYPSGISILVLPCGEERDNFSFSGTLLERSEYIEPERATLLARHGAQPSEWTTVGLVARAGRAKSAPSLEGVPSNLISGQAINRRQLERLIQGVTEYLEAAGMSEAPVAPGIAIIPLAVYRTIIAPTP